MPNTVQVLKRALAIAERIQSLEAELAGVLQRMPGDPSPLVDRLTSGRMGAAVQRRRWAKAKRHVGGKAASGAGRKNKLSAAGRAAIAAAQKKRWAKVRAAKKAGD